jgi:hypothetical protein
METKLTWTEQGPYLDGHNGADASASRKGGTIEMIEGPTATLVTASTTPCCPSREQASLNAEMNRTSSYGGSAARHRESPCQPRARTGPEIPDIERHQDDEETGIDQERSSSQLYSKRPCKRQASGSSPLTGMAGLFGHVLNQVWATSRRERTRPGWCRERETGISYYNTSFVLIGT